MAKETAYRGRIFYFNGTATLENLPKTKEDFSRNSSHYVYLDDGVLIVANGKIKDVGSYTDLKNKLSDTRVIDYKGHLITPGFIDTHQHATQSGIVASYGEKLLEWLQRYVFPEEGAYADKEIARKELNFFIDLLLRNGTTTGVAYGPLFYDAADLFFAELDKRQMRFITGNVLMDTNAPDYLRLATTENYDNAKKLIQRWHNKNRLSYCISPRFALACSPQLLELCGQLKKEYPDAYIQTHLNENQDEIAEVKKVFPWSKNYLDVYHHFGLVTPRSIFGHCVHTNDSELTLLQEKKSIISWCPISNNFLGSGLFNFKKVVKYTHNITLGTDWGAGYSLSMFKVMDEAYKVAILNNYKLPSMQRWFMCTLGAAKALQLDDKIGSFKAGNEADFIVIDPNASPYMQYRLQKIDNLHDLLFVLMTLGDEQNIRATYILGELAYEKL